jgi:hypothetical protein
MAESREKFVPPEASQGYGLTSPWICLCDLGVNGLKQEDSKCIEKTEAMPILAPLSPQGPGPNLKEIFTIDRRTAKASGSYQGQSPLQQTEQDS